MATPAPDEKTPAEERRLALRVVTMPRDTNPYGTVFGGVILSYIDQAGFVEARSHGAHRWVTASMDHIDFKAPVQLGDIVTFYTCTIRTGRSSVTVRVDVEAQRLGDAPGASTVPVTTATLTLVAVDEHGRSVPFDSPPTVGQPA